MNFGVQNVALRPQQKKKVYELSTIDVMLYVKNATQKLIDSSEKQM